ncbi:MAG: purine-cytosine permease family protein [Tepidanaerobacteraceae bacterium]|jgi:cytosine permease
MGLWDNIKQKLTGTESAEKDLALNPVPLEKRESWLGPATVYAGVEFSFTVVMTGAALASGFSIGQVVLLIIIALVVITWIGDSINAYLGAKTGLSGTVIARQSLGSIQARIIASLSVLIMMIGWWAVNTALVANAFCVAFGIDYTQQFGPWAIMVIIMGIIFMAPALLGFTSMKLFDYLAVPAGLLIFGFGIYLSVKAHGITEIFQWAPQQTMTWSTAISTILGLNICQWVMISDYSRLHRPILKDSILMPSLIVVVGFVEILIGAIMAVGIGTTTFDIIQVMVVLGYPFWAYLLLFIAQWTSQIVSVYSAGLSLGNMFNTEDLRTQKLLTLSIGVIGIILALAGILNRFMDFLLLLGILFAPLAAVMAVDFFFLRKQKWEDIKGWNLMATITLVLGILIGYYFQYVNPFGIAAVQSYILTGIVYYVLMRVKAAVAPDNFTPESWKTHISKASIK